MIRRSSEARFALREPGYDRPRSRSNANTPAAAEDVPGYESGGWFGYVAPAGTPRDIVLKLNGEINRAMQQPDVAEKLVSAGLIIVGESPEYFSGLLKNDFMKYGKLVRDIGYRPQ